MGWRRTGVMSVGLIAVLAAAGCGGGVTFAGQDLDSEVAPLGQIEQQFRDNATRGKTNLGDDSRCWFLKNPDTGELDSVAACGPVRHLGATESGVWDLYRFNGDVNEKSLLVNDIGLDTSGASLPRDRELFRGDGAKVPDDPDGLAAPEAPPVPAGMARVMPGVQVENITKPGKGVIVVPGAKVEVIEVGEVKTVPGDEQSPVYRAADGEEFRAISLNVTQDENYQSADIDITPAYSVKFGAQKTPLDFTQPSDEISGTQTGRRDVVVSVPKGKDASVVVSVAGADQTFSVRTGERTSTNAAAYYRTNATVAVNKLFSNRTVKKGDFEINHQVTFTEAEVTPFDEKAGWASTGKSWLRLAYDNEALELLGDKATMYDYTVNLRAGMTVVDDSGRRSAVTTVSPVDDDDQDDIIAVQVADDARWIDVSYGPIGTFSVEMPVFEVTPRSGTWAFKPMRFRINLPR